MKFPLSFVWLIDLILNDAFVLKGLKRLFCEMRFGYVRNSGSETFLRAFASPHP
jgi:hypothetical protein